MNLSLSLVQNYLAIVLRHQLRLTLAQLVEFELIVISCYYTDIITEVYNMNNTQKVNIFLAYILGVVAISILPMMLVPASLITKALFALSVMLLTYNLHYTLKRKQDAEFNIAASFYNFRSGIINWGGNFSDWFTGTTGEKSAGELSYRENVVYSLATLCLTFFAANFMPVRLAANLLYVTLVSYIASMMRNYELATQDSPVPTEASDKEKNNFLKHGTLCYENNPVEAFSIYCLGTGEQVIAELNNQMAARAR